MTAGRTGPGEFDLIRWVRDRTGGNASTVLGIGDDAAILRPEAGADLVVTTDMLMDGRHFILSECGPEAAGFKAMAVNVSDVAAMAARPLAAVVGVALPRGDARRLMEGLHAGIADCASRFGVVLVGGDTNAWDGPLVVSVTLLGQTVGRGAVRRSGARVGDVIFVTGPLGGSILGRHLRPTPRVAEAIALNEAAPLHALIDISDGLAGDLGHILEESGALGAELEGGLIPVHADALTLSRRDGSDPLAHALHDGEDFELCVVTGADDALRLEARPPGGVRLVRIGRVVEGPGIWLRDASGGRAEVLARGFDHLRRGGPTDVRS